jgi:hypothetical protein
MEKLNSLLFNFGVNSIDRSKILLDINQIVYKGVEIKETAR